MEATISQDIQKAKDLLESGELVAIPTETVYGLAANALHPEAVIKIFETKNRPHFDPLIVHVASVEQAKSLAIEFPAKAQLLAEKFWPGPLTLLLKKKSIIPDLVTSGLDTVGIRMPEHPLTLELLRKLDFPLAAPSANPFGYISPTTAEHVKAQLGEKIQLILDGGPCEVGVESTIIDCTQETPVVVRLGGLGVEKIESIIGKVNVNTTSSSKPSAPGLLISHYAPRKPFLLGNIQELVSKNSNKKIALITFEGEPKDTLHKVLSREGSLNEAARNLFKVMRELDQTDADVIIAEPVPDHGLGRAINDRLRRAAANV
ncbi:MAG TPA: L-threonylcarbamoyladenylate synthase [Flavobacteriales bacterium]